MQCLSRIAAPAALARRFFFLMFMKDWHAVRVDVQHSALSVVASRTSSDIPEPESAMFSTKGSLWVIGHPGDKNCGAQISMLCRFHMMSTGTNEVINQHKGFLLGSASEKAI